MNRFFILVALLLVFSSANAHNPNTTSVVISPQNGIWTAHFVISQEGANYALAKYYSDIDLQKLSTDKYKKLYIDYIKSHSKLIIDKKEIGFGSGGIKLGNHQTDIRLLIPDFPKEFIKIEYTLTVFEENKNQNTVVRFENKNKNFRKVLSKQKGFTLNLNNTDNAFVGHQDKEKSKHIYYLLTIIILCLGIFIYWNRRKKTEGNNG